MMVFLIVLGMTLGFTIFFIGLDLLFKKLNRGRDFKWNYVLINRAKRIAENKPHPKYKIVITDRREKNVVI